MELEEFIRKTLVSIVKGMKSVNKETKLEDRKTQRTFLCVFQESLPRAHLAVGGTMI